MHDRLERRLRWLFGAAAAAFGSFGVTVVLALLGIFPDALVIGEEASRWTPFAMACAVGGTLLSARVARAPRLHTFPMVVLAAGAFTSGLTLLALGLAGPGPMPRSISVGAAFDLLAGTIFLAAWLRLWLAAVPGRVREQRDEEILSSLLHALVPEGGAVAIGAADERIREAILRRRSASAGELRMRLELRLLDLASRLLVRRRFAQASPDARSEALARLCGSRIRPARQTALAWRGDALGAFYADERVLKALGFDRQHLERRLAEGPNRDIHRARRERAAGADSFREPSALRRPSPEGAPPVLRLVRTGGPTSA